MMSWALVGQISVLAVVGTICFGVIYGLIKGKNKEDN